MVKTRFRSAGASDPGRIRTNNEDAWYTNPERGIFLVVDGIGGQAAGEKAAEIAVSRLKVRLERQTGTTEQRLREAITLANNEILDASRKNPEWRGMACVLTAVVVENGEAVAGHVGDSRLYKIRGGRIQKMTHDHSPVGEREDRGEISEDEAMRHPRRNEVYRDVGSEEHAPNDSGFIEIRRFEFEPDSALVLCSDGLSDLAGSETIRQIVEQYATEPERAVQELIAAANQAGGKDNITAVVVAGQEFTATAPGRMMIPARARLPVALFVGLPLAGALVAAAALVLIGPKVIRPQTVTIVQLPRTLTVGRGERLTGIAAAIAEARPGDTVEVLGDEYREAVILKSGVTLRSRPPRAAILRAAPLSNGPAVYGDGVKGARLSGFLIQANEQDALLTGIALRDSDVEIDDVEIAGARIGIEVRGGTAVLTGNSIHECTAEGVLLLGPSTAWVANNTFRRNRGPGLAAREGAKPWLVDNVFERNSVELPPGEPMEIVRARNYILGGRTGGRSPQK